MSPTCHLGVIIAALKVNAAVCTGHFGGGVFAIDSASTMPFALIAVSSFFKLRALHLQNGHQVAKRRR